MRLFNVSTQSRLPWWTWVLPLVVFQGGTQLGEYFSILPGVSLFYLPIPLGIVLINWWGPRVAVAFFANMLISSYLWGFSHVQTILLVACQQTSTVLLSWGLCKWRKIDVVSLRTTNHLLGFIAFGLAIPITFNSTYAYFFGRHIHEIWTNTVIIWFVDFFTTFVVTIPILFFLSPFLSTRNWLIEKGKLFQGVVQFETRAWVEVVSVAIFLSVISQTLDFQQYWFIYGATAILVAVRLGFEFIILINLLIYSLTYLMPFINLVNKHNNVEDLRIVNLHIGMSMLCVSAAVIGRVISDLKQTREEQIKINAQLKTMNQELDSFVYSVSHDLSSPLKSVRGLINIIRLESDPAQVPGYINMIEQSVNKLDSFITEVLDYSRSSRKEVVKAPVDLRKLLEEIMDNHRFMDAFDRIDFRLNIDQNELSTDRLLVKTILNNLISNAIKYQRRGADDSWVVINSSQLNGRTIVEISDNGEGIPEAMVPRIFEMFYKGDQVARGSGLGLYIAKSAADKLGGSLTVKSKIGEGSTFVLEL